MVARLGKSAGAAAAAIAAILSGVAAANAYTESLQEFVCPYDGVKFKSPVMMSGSSFGRYLDLRLVGAIASTPPLPTCPTNGFVFLKGVYDRDSYSNEELEDLRPIILSPEYQALKSEASYRRVAYIFEQQHKPHIDVSWQWLMATWQVSSDPVRYKAYAGVLVDRLVEDEVDSKGDADSRATIRALRGELQRRIGRFSEATQTFTELEATAAAASNFARIARFQLKLISEGDTNPHELKEALGQ